MPESERPNTTSEGKKPQRASWREWLRRLCLKWELIAFAISQFGDRAVRIISPEATERLRELNTLLTAAAGAVQPWHGAALFWEQLTTNWPDDLNPIGIPSFLFARIITGGIVAVSLALSNPQTAILTFVGYGLGLYIVWWVCDALGKELDLIVGIVGTILVGGLCLMVLQPIMLMATAICGALLGTESGGTGFLAGVAGGLVGAFVKHVLENRAAAQLEKLVGGASATRRDLTTGTSQWRP